jgi:hypothetical protein
MGEHPPKIFNVWPELPQFPLCGLIVTFLPLIIILVRA